MSEEPFKLYMESVAEKLQKAFRQEKEIQIAARWIANCLKNEGWIYTAGTGHSHILAEEIFYRAGGFARIRPVFDEALMLHKNATASTEVERTEGYAGKLLKQYPISPLDVFFISSNSGRNPVPIEMAQLAQKKGAKVIAITNLRHSKSVDSRHSSGLKLFQIADLFLDNFGEIGDATVAFEGLDGKVGATSTVIGTALMQSIMVQAVGLLLKEGRTPEVYISSNSDIGEANNQALITKYKPMIKGL